MSAHNVTALKTPEPDCQPADMRSRQSGLRQRYRQSPQAAIIVDSARTTSMNVSAQDPIRGNVLFGHVRPADLATGVHRKVGGDSDLPNPGEILAAALASCLDSTIRIVANLNGIGLSELDVTVDATVDARGTLMVDRQVPVGFQSIDVRVHMVADGNVPQVQLDRVLAAAEASCVVLQTLTSPPCITLERG